MGGQALLLVALASLGVGAALALLRLRAYRVVRQRRLRSEAEDNHGRLRDAVAALFGGEYLAASEVAAWRAGHGGALALAAADRWIRQLPEPLADEARGWSGRLRGLDQSVREHNQCFVSARLREDREALDRVERYPLTERQRVAIVTGEDSTLVT